MDRDWNYGDDFMDADDWHLSRNRSLQRAIFELESPRSIPKDGDVVFGRGGTVHRVGDTPRKNRQMTTEVARVSSQDKAVEQLRAALANFAGVQSLLNRFGGQEPPIGSVLRWVKEYDRSGGELIVTGLQEGASSDDLKRALKVNVSAPTSYVYVAFRSNNGKWYTTAQRGSQTYEWDALVREIGDSLCELASDWVEVPQPEKPSDEAMDPTNWARMMFGQKAASETQATPSDEKKS